jgi:HEAT repeat protein
MPANRLCAATLLIPILLSPLSAADPGPGDPVESLLKARDIPTDGPGLLQYIKDRTAIVKLDVDALIKQLGDDKYDLRQAASAALVKAGKSAIPALQKATKSADPEIARRAADCIQAIEGDKDPLLDPLAAAVRLLARHRPDGATAALIAYLPNASSPQTKEEIWFALDVLTAAAKDIDPLLLEALGDKSSDKRAVAGCFVGRGGTPAQQKLVRKLLADEEPEVRLRAAQGLLAGGDASGVPALIAMLDDGSPITLAWQAEELLVYLAGKERPEHVLGAADAPARKRCRQAWDDWLKNRAGKVDAAEVLLTARRPRLLLALTGTDEIALSGCDGHLRWKLNTGKQIFDAWMTSDATVWTAGWNGKKNGEDVVTLIDLSGKVKETSGKANSLFAYHLMPTAKGQVIAVTYNGIYYVQDNGSMQLRQSVRLYADIKNSKVASCEGRVVYPEETTKRDAVPKFMEVNVLAGTSRELTWISTKSSPTDYTFEALRDGGLLFFDKNAPGEGFRRFNSAGEVVRRYPLFALTCATELHDGHLLLMEGRQLIELDDAGRMVWETTFPSGASRVREQFPLVRVGFPPPGGPAQSTIDLHARGLRSGSALIRSQTLAFLRKIGPDAAEALPSFARALNDPKCQLRTEILLLVTENAPRGATTVPALIEELAQADEVEWHGTALVLLHVGPAAVPALGKAAVYDPRPRVRANALFALSLLNEEAVPARDAVLAALTDRDAGVRYSAIAALGSSRALLDAAGADRLVGALIDDNAGVRGQAVQVLARLESPPKKAAEPLLRMFEDPDLDQPLGVAQALGNIGRRDPAVSHALLRHLKERKDSRVRVAAAAGISRTEANGGGAIPALARLIQKPDAPEDHAARKLREAAVTALGELGRHDEAAVRALVSELETNKKLDDDDRRAILSAMRNFGPNGKPALPLLLSLLRKHDDAAPAAVRALAGIGEPAAAGLLDLLKTGDAKTHGLALSALALMGPAAKGVEIAVTAELRADAAEMRRDAAMALGGIGPGAEKSVPALLKALADPEYQVRRAAVEALGKIAPADERVAAALLPLLKDAREKPGLRCAAAWALGAAGARGKDAVGALLDVYEANRVDPGDGNEARRIGRRLLLEAAQSGAASSEHPAIFIDVGACSLLALRRLGPNAAAAVPRLLAVCEDQTADPFERWAAAEAQGAIGATDKVVPALTALLKNERTPAVVQIGVVNALAALAASQKETRELFETVKVERPRSVRLAARAALDRMNR